ncbi:biotin--[acetyl-CoA-carboxylase] ligase [Chloroflexota bacterium]|nr:biotin--[acetyl-CoA-carboxylase] ligase [Chloroflexota bacterium]
MELSEYLASLNLPDWRYLSETGSTNDLALAWAGEGAADGSLVLADRQTAGRGRAGRHWMTKSGAAIAMSLVLRPAEAELAYIPRFTALATLGLVSALASKGLNAEIKWPNDVLLAGRKVAGVLVEAFWQGENLEALVVGMGVNVSRGALPPAEECRYPATTIEDERGESVDRWEILAGILHSIFTYRTNLTTDAFMAAWNEKLAFKGEQIAFRLANGQAKHAKVLKVQPDGRLALQVEGQTEPFLAAAGEIEMAGRDG